MAGEDAAAAANYERIIKQKPQDVEAYLALGFCMKNTVIGKKLNKFIARHMRQNLINQAIANNLSYLLLEHGGDLG